MSKKQIKLLLRGISSLLLSLIMTSFVAAQSFDPVFEWTKRFQRGEKIELKVHVGTDSFTFLRSQTTNIDRAIFQRLLPKDILPQQLKILPDEGLVIGYEVNKLLRLEETWREDKSKVWKKIEFIKIASYPLTRWPDFIKQAISQGLMEYEVIEYEGESFASLTFKQTDPSSLQFGRRSLKFSDEFYEYMKLSKEFKPWVSNTDKFAILVHEPHWCLASQYQLIPGLKAFIDANSQYKFRFLVEGYWEEEIKYIPTKPTLRIFSKDISKEVQVFALLRNFLIDGPFAYRLLYDPDLPAVAIDSPELIQNTTPEQKIMGWIKTSKVLKEIIQKLKGLPSDETYEAQLVLIILSYYARADASELKGPDFIKHFENVAKLYDGLAKSLKTLKSKDFTSEISFLETQAKAYRTNIKRYQIALDRDATMATNISKHFISKEYSNRIPIVFIGNFHTPAITSHLRSKGIGYVVIEPRVFLIATERERRNFNDALNLNTRQNYLKKLVGDLKLQVAPTEAELPYYQSFLRKKASSSIRAQNASLQQSYQSLGPNRINLAFLNRALETNGFLNNAQVSFAGGGKIPPHPFQKAFASLSFGSEGGAPMLVFFYPNEKGWERQDRYRFLQKVKLIPPYEEIQKHTRKVRFYQDQETNRIFCSYFDPKSQRFYLFEGDEIDIFRMLPLPREKDEEETLIHMRISIRDIIYYEKEKMNG